MLINPISDIASTLSRKERRYEMHIWRKVYIEKNLFLNTVTPCTLLLPHGTNSSQLGIIHNLQS